MPIQSLHKSHDQVNQHAPVEHTRRRTFWFWIKITISIVSVLVIFIGVLGYRLLAAVNTTVEGNKRVSVFTQLGHLISNRDAELHGESEDRVNILLLGIGGEGHEGPLLADTIMLASIKPSTGQVALLSIPRDLAVEIPRYGIRKINNANAFGIELHYPGGGEKLTADIVSTITGQPVYYFARIDFAGFRKIIDDLGGITISVERSFVDREYPTEDFGYQTIRFDAGKQTMDGATALKFVRSRHGNNGEGSDFARSRRQQLVLEAIRDRGLSFGTILNPVRVGNVLSSLGTHTRTNMEIWELLRLGRIVRSAASNDVMTYVLESGPQGLLKTITGIDNAFLLAPKDGTYDAIKTLVRDIFVSARYRTESAAIRIIDATGRSGSGKTLASTLSDLGYSQPSVQTNGSKSVEATTLLIDYSRGGKPYTVHGLESFLGVSSISNTPALLDPRRLKDIVEGRTNTHVEAILPEQPAATDILIILGKDYLTRLSTKRTTQRSS